MGFVGLAILVAETVETMLAATAAVNLALVFVIVALPSLVGRLDGLPGMTVTE